MLGDLKLMARARDAWHEFAMHGVGCIDCSGLGYASCPEGNRLQCAATAADEAAMAAATPICRGGIDPDGMVGSDVRERLSTNVIEAFERLHEYICAGRPQGQPYTLFSAKADLWNLTTHLAAAREEADLNDGHAKRHAHEAHELRNEVAFLKDTSGVTRELANTERELAAERESATAFRAEARASIEKLEESLRRSQNELARTDTELFNTVASANKDRQDADRYRALRALCEESVGAAISVNEHRLVYEDKPDWDACYVQWYPNTPIGFSRIGGATFDEMADAARAAAERTPT